MKTKQKHDNGMVLTVVAAVVIIAFALGGVWFYSLIHPKLSMTLSSDRSIVSREGAVGYLGEKYADETFTIESAEDSSYADSNCDGKLNGLANWTITDVHGVVFSLREVAAKEPSSLLGCVVEVSPVDDYQEALAVWIANNSEGEISTANGYIELTNASKMSESDTMKSILDKYVELRALGYSDEILPSFHFENEGTGEVVIVSAIDDMAAVREKIKVLHE